MDLHATISALTREIYDWRMENGDLDKRTQILKVDNEGLRKEIRVVQARNHDLDAQNHDLKVKLSASDSASKALRESYNSLQRKHEALRLQLCESQSRHREAQAQLNSPKHEPGQNETKICLIDGNTAMFSEELVSQGKAGGHKAANLLRRKIHEFFDSSGGEKPGSDCGLPRGWTLVTVFMDANGVAGRLSLSGICCTETFKQFIVGFHETPLFTVVDVGSDKDATSAKLREYLLYYSRLPQTAQLIFTRVSNDFRALQVLQNEGLLAKATVLKGGPGVDTSKEDEIFLTKVTLKTINVPGLFSQQDFTSSNNQETFVSPAAQGESTLIVCLFDGDSVVFNEDLLAKGKTGGHQAAIQLGQWISQHLDNGLLDGTGTCTLSDQNRQLVTNIFLDAAGLADNLAYNGICSTRDFEQFVLGFNQATPLFTMVDIGPEKDKARERLNETLLLYSRLSQTRMMVLGGTHDDRHISTLKTLQTEGHLHKTLVLRGSVEVGPKMEAFCKEADIAMIDIPHLFLERMPTSEANQPSNELVTSPPTMRPPSETPKDGSQFPSLLGFRFQPSSTSIGATSGRTTPEGPPICASSPPSRVLSPSQLPLANGDARNSPELGSTRRRLVDMLQQGPAGELVVDSTKPLTKQSPHICYWHYLAPACPKGSGCAHSHQYKLTPAQLNRLRVQVKKVPCAASQNSRRPCPNTPETCIMGHYCPNGPSCPRKKAKCMFKGEKMHTLPGATIPSSPSI